MKRLTLDKSAPLFFALNVVFSVYLFSVDIFSALLLFIFSVVAFYIYKRENKHKILNLSGFKIRADVFEKLLSLIPFSVRITDINGVDLVSNGRMNSKLGDIIKEFNFENSKIIKAKIDNQIQTFYTFKGNISTKGEVVGHLIVELAIDDILAFLSSEMMKNVGTSENILTAFDNINDALALYEIKNDEIGALYVASPSFYNLISPKGADSAFLDLFNNSEKKRVDIIFDGIGKEPILFETLMGDEALPVEIYANIFTLNNKTLLNLSIRNISIRKEHIRKRDRERIIKIKENERMQKIQMLYLTLNKINEILRLIKSNIDEFANHHNELRGELIKIADLHNAIIDSINQSIHFYSQTDIKTMVNIAELIATTKKTIFPQSLINNNHINFTQKTATHSIYCDKNALKAVLVTIFSNALEHISIVKGSNFYGQINVQLEDLNDYSVLLSIEDNGGGIEEEYLKRSFDMFYTTRAGRAGLGLSACKIFVEDLLYGEIMAMNTEDGFRIEITLPKDGIKNEVGGGDFVTFGAESK
ncbi:sensor histidine kinase [Helicobacter sp. 23-1045]